MSDYLDAEAQESDDEEELTENERRKLKRVRAESDDEEDDEAQYIDELKDFIEDANVDSGEESGDEEQRRKRKRGDVEREALDDQLEDDDYDLLEENLGIKVQRQKKFRRVRVEEESDEEREPLDDGTSQDGMEGSDEETREEPEGGGEAGEEGGEGDSDQEDDMDNFIVDEEGNPIAAKGKKKRRHQLPDSGALQDAQDIFGVDFDFEEMEQYEAEGEAAAEEEGEEGEDYEEEDYDEDDEEEGEEGRSKAPGRKKGRKAAKKKKVAKQSIFELYEPAELERGHFTDLDNRIRSTDVPERMQTRAIPVTPVAGGLTDKELEDESEWIYKVMFNNKPISVQKSADEEDRDPLKLSPEEEVEKDEKGMILKVLDEEEKKSLREKKHKEHLKKIKHALDFMRNSSLEVPFIAYYRKEYIEPELNVNDLWRIYKLDEKWCQLKTRKENLLRLMKNMMSYQHDMCFEHPNSPLPDDMKVLDNEDLDRLMEVETFEEFHDIYSHFLLYNHHHLQPMQEHHKRKKREAIETKRREREERRAERQRRRMKTVTVKKTVTDEETGEEKEIEVEEEVEASDEEPEEPESEEEPLPEEDEEEDTMKLPMRRDPYNVCRRAGLIGFAVYYGLSPQKFAENVREEYQKHDVTSIATEPTDAARDYVSAQFPEPEDVINAANFMVANQFAMEPAVRKAVREKVFQFATVNVRPTKKGFKEIDEGHVLFPYKYVSKKPVRDFRLDQFLTLVIGEEDQLITIDYDCNVIGSTDGTKFMDEVKLWYYKDEFTSHVQLWNKIRGTVVEVAFEKFLWPTLKKELKRKLLTEAKEAVIRVCSLKLFDAIKVAPYRGQDTQDDDDEWDNTAGVRVMGIAYSTDHSLAAFASLVDVDGEVCDVLRLPNLLKRKTAWRDDDRAAKLKDLRTLYDFMLRRKPHVVVIGAESRDALMIQEDVAELVAELEKDEHFPNIPIEFMSNDLAKIYANSIKGQGDFKEYPDLLRQAISLARRLQDPLLEFAQLCTMDEELVCVQMHPLQNNVSKDELLESLYKELINRVNDVGVDMNRCIAHPHAANVLQFVAGLGPRKAAYLLKTFKQKSQRLENRTQLVTLCHMGPKVFINCAGFIKIDTNSLGDSADSYVEVLDSTRVHPETYEWARKMAVDALEYDELAYDSNPAAALEEVLECPERLNDLDLHAFAVELERQGYGPKTITLPDIRNELSNRYADNRVEYTSPNEDDKFAWFFKETPETFYIGKLILATVVNIVHRKLPPSDGDNDDDGDKRNPIKDDKTNLWQCNRCLQGDFSDLSDVWAHMDNECKGRAVGVRLRLDNGLSGFIPVKSLSDSEVTNPENRVRPGQIIQCRITKINVDKFSVECTSKTSDLVDAEESWRPDRDPHYDFGLERLEIQKDEQQKKAVHKRKNAYMSRVIVHPNFYNIDYSGAELKMASMQQGDVIIRPSSQGVDHLTVTWKVTDGVHQHIDVKEKHKENAFSLGKSLWINGEEYEDLDEIVARHVNPMAAHARDILNYKYYRDTQGGNREIAEDILREEKRKAPNKIPYIISVVAKELPGKFMLSYQPRLKARHEYITVTPEGFRYRKQVFETLNGLLKWFKEHHRDPIPNTPGAQSVANTAPTPGGFSLASASRDVVRQAAQNIPSHIYSTLSQAVAAGGQTPHTPHYPHTPHTPFTHYTQTPYTPSGQTPFMTPYHPVTPGAQPRVASQGSRSSQSQSNHHGHGHVHGHGLGHPQKPDQNHVAASSAARQPGGSQGYSTGRVGGGGFGGDNWSSSASQSHQHQSRSQQGDRRPAATPSQGHVAPNRPHASSGRTPSSDLHQWHKAAEAWVKQTNRPTGARTPRTPGMTPRYEDPRRTPATPMDRRTPRASSYADGTPLYDE